jgi:hypothetical protein
MDEARISRARNGLRIGFHEELVPLYQACAAAYHALLDGPGSAHPRELEEARGLIAIALSRVATLYRVSPGVAAPLSESELRQALFVPAAADWQSRLHNLSIRRSALVGAVEALKTARFLFDGRP